jgi:ABC-2 type transport system ATP-binding protein
MTSTTDSRSTRVAVTTDSGEPVVTVDGLAKSYGDRAVLDGVSFSVHRQEIFGILGPNGAGKTTTVETVQGLRTPSAGTVRVMGLDPARDRAQLRRVVGAQLQSSALPDRLRVGEALRLFARLAGDVVDWRALRDTWGLERLEGTAFAALSGGERQRLFIALALVNRPRVVFLDELTQGLDPAARRETWQLIRRIRAQGATVVLVSHYMDEVEQLCDRVAVLFDGRITACDTPAGLIQQVGGWVRTRFSNPGALDRVNLPGIRGVDSVSTDGGDVEVVGSPATPVLVAAALAEHDIVPDDFAVVRPSLEDVFVHLTTGGRS